MKSFKKCTSILLIILAVFPLFTGCSGGQAALEYDDVTISKGIYRYWLSSFKYYFTTQFEDVTDTPESWNKTIEDDVTVGEYVERYTLEYAKSMICSLALYKKYKLSLPDETTDTIDDNINEIIRYQYGDSRSKFSAALQDTYGIGIKELRNAFLIEAKVSVLEEYLFGENGIEKPTDSELNEFYQKNYARYQVIMVKTEFDYVYDEDGKLTFDSSGNPVTKAYTDEQKAAKAALIEEVWQKASSGEDFAELAKKYDELTLKDEDAVAGYTFSVNDYDTIVGYGYSAESLSKALKLKDGEIDRYAEKNAVYIVKRVPLIAGAYKNAEEDSILSSIQDHAITDKYNTMLNDMMDDIEINDYVNSLKTVDVKIGII